MSFVTLYKHLATFDLASDVQTSNFLEDWIRVFVSYCSRELTYEIDKPIALRGIADEIATRTDLSYHFGVRSKSIPRQLLWFEKDGVARPSILKCTPSQSWASTMGSVAYPNPAQTARQFAENVSIHGNKLVLHSLLTSATSFRGLVNASTPEMREMSNCMSRSTFLTRATLGPISIFFRWSVDDAIGWASFDEGILPESPFYVLPLSINTINAALDEGYNVLFIRLCSSNNSLFERVSIGEILKAEL